MVVGFIGALIIVRPGLKEFELGSLLVLLIMLLWGVLDILIKVMNRTESITGQILYMMGIITLCYAPLAIINWKNPVNFTDFILLILLGIIFSVYMLSILLAFKYSEISTLMPVYFSEVVFVDIVAFFSF